MDRPGRESRVKACGIWVVTTDLSGTVYVSLIGLCVCLSPAPPQDMSELKLTVQMSKQNGTWPREVLLVLGVDKMVFLRLQAPGIPLLLAFVSALPPTPG